MNFLSIFNVAYTEFFPHLSTTAILNVDKSTLPLA